jgi:hypothetical protein
VASATKRQACHWRFSAGHRHTRYLAGGDMGGRFGVAMALRAAAWQLARMGGVSPRGRGAMAVKRRGFAVHVLVARVVGKESAAILLLQEIGDRIDAKVGQELHQVAQREVATRRPLLLPFGHKLWSMPKTRGSLRANVASSDAPSPRVSHSHECSRVPRTHTRRSQTRSRVIPARLCTESAYHPPFSPPTVSPLSNGSACPCPRYPKRVLRPLFQPRSISSSLPAAGAAWPRHQSYVISCLPRRTHKLPHVPSCMT